MRELNPYRIGNISISRGGSFVIADFWENESTRWNGKQCLGMVDLRTDMFRKVLPSQRLGNDYYPSWTSNGTIIELDMPAGEGASLSLMDLSGRKLRTVELSSSGVASIALPVAGIPPGFFLIAVKPARGAPVYKPVLLE